MKYNKYILVLIGWLCASWAVAQDISIPFFCGFEDSVELSQWTLNPQTSDAKDQWCVGTATHSEGRKSLYISNDSAQSAKHGVDNNIVMAYRTIKFPRKGKYNISFDWKNLGGIDDRARLYVWVGPKMMLTRDFYRDSRGTSYGLLDILNSSSSIIANANLVQDRFYKLSDGTNTYDYLAGSKKWQNVFVKGDGVKPEVSISLSQSAVLEEFVLAFIWINASHDTDPVQLGACVDNLQIASAELKRPFDLQATMHCEDSTVMISWESSLPSHDIEYRKTGSGTWRKFSDIPATSGLNQSYSFVIKQEGSYDFRVRGYNVSRTDTSAYASLNNFIFWCFDNHCINYIDLNSPTVVCRHDEDPDTWPNICQDCIGVFNFGEESMESRHTVNWIEERYDPFTIGSKNMYDQPVEPLRTIPEGYLASVRLGNWDTGHERESITYSFVVDSMNQSILIMKYAILFEAISGHDNAESLFNLEVLDSKGRLIDPTCGVVNFEFKDASEWNVATDVSHSGRKIGELYWKDWSSIGLNLNRYHGETLQVRVTVADCGLGAHAAWAYFVLDCVSARLETENCGASSTISVHAPEGFDYTWTNSKDSILGHDQFLEASANRETYTCEACIKEMSGCCFTLSTVFEPRYPAPQFAYEWVPANCENLVQFYDKSHVMTKHDGQDVHTSEACEQVVWEFTRRGYTQTTPDENPLLLCDPYGDTIIVTLRASIGGGLCDSVMQDTIYIAPIITRDSIINAHICEGETFIFAKQGYKESGTYYDTKANFAGCDSTSVLNLTVHPHSEPTFASDTVCSTDLPYSFNGYSYIYPGTYSQDLKNQWECDSLVTLSLHVLEKLELDVEQLPTLCADNEQLIIDYTIMQSAFDSLAIRFFSSKPQTAFYNQTIYDNTRTTIVYPYDESILPDHYRVQLEFYQHAACGNQVFDLEFDVQYRSSIIEQKWNDVLALLNSKYNGGYTFSAYQWYKDGQAIPGATQSYLYQELDMNSQYSVELTRTDGVVISTCPFQPTVRTDVYQFPTLAQPSQKIPVRATGNMCIAQVNIYNMMGQKYSTDFISGGQGEITAPALSGNYVVEMVYDDGERKSQLLVVTNTN